MCLYYTPHNKDSMVWPPGMCSMLMCSFISFHLPSPLWTPVASYTPWLMMSESHECCTYHTVLILTAIQSLPPNQDRRLVYLELGLFPASNLCRPSIWTSWEVPLFWTIQKKESGLSVIIKSEWMCFLTIVLKGTGAIVLIPNIFASGPT